MNRAERAQIREVIGDVRGWISAAQEVRHWSAHMPLSGAVDLGADGAVLPTFDRAEASGDLESAASLARPALFSGRKSRQPAHEAAERLTWFHQAVREAASDEVLKKMRAALFSQVSDESERLRQVLEDLEGARRHMAATLDDAAHMPVGGGGVLGTSEKQAMTSLVRVVDTHEPAARRLLTDPASCADGSCRPRHSSAATLAAFLHEVRTNGALQEMWATGERISTQLTAERAQIRALAERMQTWQGWVDEIRQSRDVARADVESQVAAAFREALAVKLGEFTVRLVPLTDNNAALISSLTFLRDASLTSADEKKLQHALDVAGRFLRPVKRGFNARWECHRDDSCRAAHELAPAAVREAQEFEKELARLVAPSVASEQSLDTLLDPSLGLRGYLPRPSGTPEMLSADLTSRAKIGVEAIVSASDAAVAASRAAKAAAEAVRAADVKSALKAMDLETLRKASHDQIRVGALSNAGLVNVWDVYKFEEKHHLHELPGIGESSARSIVQAVRRLYEGVRDETPVRIDVKRRGKQDEALLLALRAWDGARTFVPTSDEAALASRLLSLFKAKKATTRVLAVVQGRVPPDQPGISSLLSEALRRTAQTTDPADVWTDFLSRPADYFGMLTELGFITEDEKKMHGDLPEEVVEAVRAKELRRDHLTASLRAYQSFGARFCIVQEKVVIGDEMGLGKTVEALAVFAHLRAVGHSHFLVVCPAAVVSNWMRETSKHTKMRAVRLHGPLAERNDAAKSWVRNGGVAVTTYDLLLWAQAQATEVEIGCAVFDEAHYIKNPSAQRSQAAADLISSLRYAILMTGTPLENNVQEFRNLVGYVRPDLSESAPEYLPSKFRKHVAPAYLRRNQEDVLTELPELVETDDWMRMSDSDKRSYRGAVQEGNFMLMRRAAMVSGRSFKVERLIEIVGEAEANGRRVIVFSYFRDVLSEVARVLPGEVFGPLTGSLPAKDRQTLVDRFSKAKGGAVLVAQMTAGGVGLNIQSASVVVICEPQLKPTMESQAIARAHRMGQTNTVQVHRLLSEDSVDERIREILAEKRQLFDDFARDSVIAKGAPDAVDVSDAELARIVIAAERERLFGQVRPVVD
ncbi:ATP-dependent helicase [Aeromicrobium sp. S22]|uniref:DEAD/DEAH box helicase n=1 Tax=Aeromicrobium sp. S22 TaxID=2662029 RepID=UPI00129D90C7|nr:DEAD/DEAH box helicase [Aeromicrobium sp. S22]MRK01387.1 ATP-dependent helicase [Aeromicrobium sp. S22]